MSASFSPRPLTMEFIAGGRTSINSVVDRAAPGRDIFARGKEEIPLIAICHLSWNWVWQRPQQFISRLAATHPVLFVETYCSATAESFTRSRPAPNHPQVTILEIHLPAHRWSDGSFIDSERRRVLQDRLSDEFNGRFDRSVLWINDPMAVTAYVGHLGESLIVYDCMDELTQFRGAPPGLAERERELTLKADLIFCGGRKMRDKRLPLNSNTHFYGTGVDCAHFGRALSPELAVDTRLAALRGPVLGYFGVVDERLDYELLAKLADANADWHVAMVGPLAKVNQAALPQRPNLHWLGGCAYTQLPEIAKGFAVALMPFALNAATEFINPTKALEYMAAGRPVVSTALDEVKSNFSAVARVARTHEKFIDYCRSEVASPSVSRVQRGLKLAAQNTWEAIAAKMDGHIRDALTPEVSSPARAESVPAMVPPTQGIPAYV